MIPSSIALICNASIREKYLHKAKFPPLTHFRVSIPVDGIFEK